MKNSIPSEPRSLVRADFPVRQTQLRLLALICFCATSCGTQAGPRPPGQPVSGPGGADYRHAAVEALRMGDGPSEFWVFTPADPRPETAPVVIFMHGWGAVHPRAYGAWLQHLVRKGNIVIFPRYQLSGKIRTPGDVMLAGAGKAVQDAWNLLITQGPVHPQTDKLVWFGHSLGCMISANLAATSAALGLPPAGALLLVEPGGDVVPLGDIRSIPADAIIEVITGDKDSLAGETGAKAIRGALSGEPERRLEIVEMRSDSRSHPALVADHFAPLGVADGFPPAHITGGDMELSGGPLREYFRERRQDRYALDALDYFGFWKIGDSLLDATYRGENLDLGFGNTTQQRFMGYLSDGTPVTPLIIIADP